MSHHIGSVLRTRRYPLSSWPWRALASLAVTALICVPAAGPVWLLILPWLVTGREILHGRAPRPAVVVVALLAVAFFVALGLVLVRPLTTLERWRLPLIDPRPLPTRPAEDLTWRALLYAVLLGLLGPPLFTGLGLAAFTVALMISSPLGTAFGVESWQFGTVTIHDGWQALPICLAGIVLLPVLLYVFGGLAAGQAWVVRRLLGGGDGLRDQLTEVSRSRARLADAFEAERRRIERDLHDGAQHRLTSLTLHLGMAQLDLPEGSPAAEPLGLAHTQAKELMVVLRDLVHGIRPQSLTDLGLPAALRELAGGSAVPVTVDTAVITGRLPERVETTAYFVAAEALANVAKHARAASVRLRLTYGGEQLALEVLDDGRGGADPARGSGLTGLADRVAAVDGRLLLASPEGGPTLLRVELPCPR
ncbi:histidine kinase [Actinoplanes sp. NPDC051851]|uniref:sensor histidine kinase n=1 Tax=Actinoplanes sp. NPDC051851 TaxID=3154753 RepID=UPI003422BEC6